MINVNDIAIAQTKTVAEKQNTLAFKSVIVINPPNPPGYVSNKDSMGGFGQLFPVGATFLPPLDLVYLASFLADKGMPLHVFESLGLDLDKEKILHEIKAAAQPGDTPTLVIARTSAPTLDWDLSVCQAIKTSTPNVRIGIYGSVVEHVLWRIQKEDAIDYIIKGEPDETVYELMTGQSIDQIQGLFHRRDGQWIANANRTAERELDLLPFPKWELFPYTKYKLPKSSARSEMPFLTMQTSRGCPIGCHYCPYPVGQGLLWRWRSPQNVVDEIEHLVRDLGIKYIIFRDPMFSLNQKRVIEICDEIVKRKLKFEWRCETRVDFLKEDTLRAMAAAGCGGVNFGVESSDVAIQKGVGRRPIEQAAFNETIALCRKLGISTFAFFIVGLPGDTVDSVLKTVKFAIDMRTTWIQFTAASPFIGTKLRDWALERGLTEPDEYAYVNSHMVLMGNGNLSKDQVKTLLDFAQFFENFVINRKGILKDDANTSPIYRAVKAIADFVSRFGAQIIYAFGKAYMERQMKSAA